MTEKPIRFLRLQGLAHDWSKHTFQEYFQRSRFSSFECKSDIMALRFESVEEKIRFDLVDKSYATLLYRRE